MIGTSRIIRSEQNEHPDLIWRGDGPNRFRLGKEDRGPI
jgi:hypothetical protein